MRTAALIFIFLFNTVLTYAQDSLYFLCKNFIDLDLKKCKIVSISGADSIVEDNQLFLIPYENETTLKVIENGVEKNKIFRVIKCPNPTIDIMLNHAIVTNYKIFRASATDFNVRAAADEHFALTNPWECRYRVSDFTIEVFRKGILVGNNDSKPNDKLRITINSIERTNFRNQKENIDLHKVFNYLLY